MILNSKYGDIRLPMHIDDIPASDWFLYESASRELSLMGSEVEPTSFIDGISKCVSAIFRDVPDKLPFGTINIAAECIVFDGVKVKDITICSLYSHILWLISTFKDMKFEPIVQYNGSTWALSNVIPNVIFGKTEEFTTQETVEWLHLDKQFSEYLDEARLTPDFDYTEVSPVDFDISLAKVALIFRKVLPDGNIEPLPFSETGIEKFIKDRSSELRGLDYSIILNVRFFFMICLTACTALSAVTEYFKGIENTRLIGAE